MTLKDSESDATTQNWPRLSEVRGLLSARLQRFYSSSKQLIGALVLIPLFLQARADLKAQSLTQGRELSIRILSAESVSSFEFSAHSGRCAVLARRSRGRRWDTVAVCAREGLRVSVEGKKLRLRSSLTGNSLGKYAELHLKTLDTEGVIELKAGQAPRLYSGSLSLEVESGHIRAINQVGLEDYVAGVVEAEAGHVGGLEFLKAQSILARTFSLRNLGKHADLGYDLKDDVSSQVYRGQPRGKHSDTIAWAVKSTRDTVLLDKACKPALVVFHANSGGQTSPSQWVWGRPIEYLSSRPDPHSLQGPSARWEKRLSKEKVHRWMAEKLGCPPGDQAMAEAFSRFRQGERKERFVYGQRSFQLTAFRHAFGLKSTWFDVYEEGTDYVLKGRGYGHGVGLAQDGAIKMSEKGFNYREILYFYYGDLELDAWHPSSLLP